MKTQAMTVTVKPQKSPPVPPSVNANSRFLGWISQWVDLLRSGVRADAYAKRSSQVQIRTAANPRMGTKLKLRCRFQCQSLIAERQLEACCAYSQDLHPSQHTHVMSIGSSPLVLVRHHLVLRNLDGVPFWLSAQLLMMVQNALHRRFNLSSHGAPNKPVFT